MAREALDQGGSDPLGVVRLLLVVCGALQAASLPAWLVWLRANRPHVIVTICVTRSALRFVTRAALEQTTKVRVVEDLWSEDSSDALHVQLARDADIVAIYPATFSFIARFASGLADTPVMLALQLSQAPVAVAPALPPGGLDSATFSRHRESLAGRQNVILCEGVPAPSAETGEVEHGAPKPLMEVVDQLLSIHGESNNAEAPSDTSESRPFRDSMVRPGVEPTVEFETDLARTTIEQLSDKKYRWTRERGRLSTEVYRPLDQVDAAIGVLGNEKLGLNFGVGGPDSRRYQTLGKASLVLWLLDNGPRSDLAYLFSELGTLLYSIHSTTPPCFLELPSPWRRLGNWFRGVEIVPRASAARKELRGALGVDDWSRAEHWFVEFLECKSPVLLHGAPSLGDIVVNESMVGGDLLAGLDTGIGDAALDLGYTVGEIYEISWQRGDSHQIWQELLTTLLSNYGTEMTREIHRAAVLRAFLHLHDYLTYANPNTTPVPHYAEFLHHLCSIDRTFEDQ